MVGLLEKLFIKDSQNISSDKTRQCYGVLCGALGIFLNCILFAGKFAAGVITNSIGIMADAFNNLSDAGSSVIMLIGFRVAGQKPDSEHPFGHGRIEYISGLIVSVFILLMAIELVKTSVSKLMHPQSVAYTNVALAILVISIFVKLYMFYYNRTVGKKINSAAMQATAIDSISDTVATLFVLVASIVAKVTGLSIDGYCGIIVGLFIFYAGMNAAKETISPLLGQPAEQEFVDQIEEIVLSHEPIIGIHDLVVHNYGPGRVMISLHAEVPADKDILEIHDVIDVTEYELAMKLNCEAVIHMDPICVNDENTMCMKKEVAEYVKTIDDSLSIHDFRMVEGNTHTNLIFDLVIPFKYKGNDDEVVKNIQEKIHEEHSNYFAVIKVDKSYVQ